MRPFIACVAINESGLLPGENSPFSWERERSDVITMTLALFFKKRFSSPGCAFAIQTAGVFRLAHGSIRTCQCQGECGPQVMVGPIPSYGRVVLAVSRYPTDHHL